MGGGIGGEAGGVGCMGPRTNEATRAPTLQLFGYCTPNDLNGTFIKGCLHNHERNGKQ